MKEQVVKIALEEALKQGHLRRGRYELGNIYSTTVYQVSPDTSVVITCDDWRDDEEDEEDVYLLHQDNFLTMRSDSEDDGPWLYFLQNKQPKSIDCRHIQELCFKRVGVDGNTPYLG